MATQSAPLLVHKFDLDAATGILASGSAASIEVTASTEPDVFLAVGKNTPFPVRASGRIELGSIQLAASAGNDIAFDAGAAKVQFKASAGAHAGMGVYDKPADAIAALALQDAAALGFTIPETAGARYLLMSWGYDVAGSASATHPLGTLGSLKFGVEAKRDALYAVLHRFPGTTGASTAIAGAVGSWRLPRQVDSAERLRPGTWLVAETEGQLALDLAAQVGYDFSFVRELNGLGLAGDVGLKLDAAVKATFGFEASGRYVIILGREGDDADSHKLRLRLYKLNKKGLTFGLNVAVGIKGVPSALPGSADDLAKAIFGVHGRQVVKDLLVLDQWTDPARDLSDTVAGLAGKTGLDLLHHATGLDASAEFANARQRVVDALHVWDTLPERAAAATWEALERVTREPAALDGFRNAVSALAVADPVERAKSLASLIVNAAQIKTIESGWLSAVAGNGLLSLTNQLEEVHQIAATVEQVLSADIVRKVQAFINDRLNLAAIEKAVTSDDVKTLDAWLVKRLSRFFDTELGFEQLDELKAAVHTVLAKREDVYKAAVKALGTRYSAELTAAYSSTTSQDALLDIEFDLSDPQALALFRKVVTGGQFDDLITTPAEHVTLHQAVLTHGIERRASIEVTLPFCSYQSDGISKSLAKLAVAEDAGRVLLYEFDASDQVDVSNRLRSRLAVAGAFPVEAASGHLRVRDTRRLSWSYEYVAAQNNMRRADLEAAIAPFVLKYLPDHFSGGASSLDTWITDFDRAVEDIVHNGSNEFGDTLLRMEVSVPGDALRAWFRKRSEAELVRDAREMSRRIQAAVKQLLPFYYFRDLGRLRRMPDAAALLVWSALPPENSLTPGSDDVFWNHPDPNCRRAMAHRVGTTARLAAAFVSARKRLLEAGLANQAGNFIPEAAADFEEMAITGAGDVLFGNLLRFEAVLVEQAAKALRDVQGFLSGAASQPVRALECLAHFGGEITGAFHRNVRSDYGGEALRPLGSLVFLEASCALDPALRDAVPNALLRISVLKEPCRFVLTDYLQGKEPAPADIALSQTLAAVHA
jgi:hypothetical protein